MLLPPPKALPVKPVRAAVPHARRDSVNTPMLAERTKSNGMCRLHATKLHLDLCIASRLRGVMEDGNTNTVSELCTQIGMLMEDASVDALTIRGMNSAERATALDRLDKAIDEMRALLAKVHML